MRVFLWLSILLCAKNFYDCLSLTCSHYLALSFYSPLCPNPEMNFELKHNMADRMREKKTVTTWVFFLANLKQLQCPYINTTLYSTALTHALTA